MSIHRQAIPEIVIEGMRLGRHIHHDERSRNYPAEQADAIMSVTHTAYGLPLNQGQVGSCTAEALLGALNSIPNFTATVPYTQDDAYSLYAAEVALEGGTYPPEIGRAHV